MNRSEKSYMAIYLGTLKPSLIDYSQSVGKSPSALIRELIEKDMAMAGAENEKVRHDEPLKTSQSAPKFMVIDSGKKEPRKRVEIRPTISEWEAFSGCANAGDISLQNWIIDTLRGIVTSSPQLNMKELETLMRSNYELVAIGRNINQIARKLNEGGNDVTSTKWLSEIKLEIDKHISHVRNLLQSNIQRWELLNIENVDKLT